MRKMVASLLVVFLLIQVGASPIFATGIQGTKCPQIGSKIAVGGKIHTCIRSGSKKVWSKGLTKRTVKATRVDLNWENVADNARQLNLDIWEKSLPKIVNPKRVVQDRLIISSPNARYGQNDFAMILNRAESYFSWAIPNLKYRVLHYSREDLIWAENKFREFFGADGSPPSCSGTCVGGTAQEDENDWGHINLALDLQDKSSPSGVNVGGYEFLLTHEFVHIVQLAQSKNNGLGSAPKWFVEGGANFFAALIGADDLEDYNSRTFSAYDFFDLNEPTKVLDYLNSPEARGDGYAYNIGKWLTKVLVGVYGPEKVISLYGAASETANFSEAFRLVFGDDWELVKPKLATAVFALKSLRDPYGRVPT